MDESLLTPAETARRVARSIRALRRDVSRGEFPQPVRTGSRQIAFRASDVQAWIASRPVVELR